MIIKKKCVKTSNVQKNTYNINKQVINFMAIVNKNEEQESGREREKERVRLLQGMLSTDLLLILCS